CCAALSCTSPSSTTRCPCIACMSAAGFASSSTDAAAATMDARNKTVNVRRSAKRTMRDVFVGCRLSGHGCVRLNVVVTASLLQIKRVLLQRLERDHGESLLVRCREDHG